jgi:hypothetical protein
MGGENASPWGLGVQRIAEEHLFEPWSEVRPVISDGTLRDPSERDWRDCLHCGVQEYVKVSREPFLPPFSPEDAGKAWLATMPVMPMLCLTAIQRYL